MESKKNKLSEKYIERVLSKLMHPEISYSLIDLGMIKNIAVNSSNNSISVSLLLPFLEIPIKEDLIHSLKEAITTLNNEVKVKVEIEEMNSQEKAKFTEMARDGWKL